MRWGHICEQQSRSLQSLKCSGRNIQSNNHRNRSKIKTATVIKFLKEKMVLYEGAHTVWEIRKSSCRWVIELNSEWHILVGMLGERHGDWEGKPSRQRKTHVNRPQKWAQNNRTTKERKTTTGICAWSSERGKGAWYTMRLLPQNPGKQEVMLSLMTFYLNVNK